MTNNFCGEHFVNQSLDFLFLQIWISVRFLRLLDRFLVLGESDGYEPSLVGDLRFLK